MIKIGLILIGLLLLFTGSMLFAGGQKEPRKVLFWTAAMVIHEYIEREEEIEEKFNIDLVVELVLWPNYVEMLQEVMENGEDVPDIIEWGTWDSRIFNEDPEKSLVLPLDDYVKDSEVFPYVIPSRVSWLTYGDHVYGLPYDTYAVVLIYNDTIWKSVGIDVAEIKTWDEFFKASKLLTAEQVEGKSLHYALPYGNDGLGNTMFMIWQQTGAQILDENGKLNFTSPEFIAFVKKWFEWVETGAFCIWDWGNFGALLYNGTLCSYASPDWWVPQVNYAAECGTYEWRVMDLPLYDEGGANTSSWGGNFLAIPKGTEDPELIYRIIEYFLYDAEAVKIRYETTGMLPPFTGVWEDEIFKQPDERFGGQKLGEIQIECAKNMPSVNMGDVFWSAIEIFNKWYQEMANGTISVEEGLAKAQAEVEALME
jgi:ABC-type glycerol-3-phosphate transport system substrate-binding protein